MLVRVDLFFSDWVLRETPIKGESRLVPGRVHVLARIKDHFVELSTVWPLWCRVPRISVLLRTWLGELTRH